MEAEGRASGEGREGVEALYSCPTQLSACCVLCTATLGWRSPPAPQHACQPRELPAAPSSNTSHAAVPACTSMSAEAAASHPLHTFPPTWAWQ